jgi:hypothetical protein
MRGNRQRGKRAKCPSCGSNHVIPIAYGLPGPELIEEEENGLVKLGGCLVADDNPKWHCKACEHSW